LEQWWIVQHELARGEIMNNVIQLREFGTYSTEDLTEREAAQLNHLSETVTDIINSSGLRDNLRILFIASLGANYLAGTVSPHQLEAAGESFAETIVDVARQQQALLFSD
jgi:uncharacterized protein YejL (UPF0352 family)